MENAHNQHDDDDDEAWLAHIIRKRLSLTAAHRQSKWHPSEHMQQSHCVVWYTATALWDVSLSSVVHCHSALRNVTE